MNIALYAHGGSANHGCEALVRSAIKVLGSSHRYTIFSESPVEDEDYGLNQLADIRPTNSSFSVDGLSSFLYKIRQKINYSDKLYYKHIYSNFIHKDDTFHLALAIGGDNYCYSGFLERFSVMNRVWGKHGIPMGLWGCSIDPERINEAMLNDLRNYQFITARESLTYNALIAHSLNNVILVPDTAFLLDAIERDLPEGFQPHNTVGINISPLVIRKEVKKGIIMRNLELLIDYILNKTDMSVALIPHVVWHNNNDQEPLSQLSQRYKSSNRLVMIPDDNAMALKGYILRCRFLIAARTHASIAGYSSSVPTLVIGYSVKSKGIAKDLFGTDQGYVLPIDSIKEDYTFCDAFRWLFSHEDEVRKRYATILPSYCQSFSQISGLIKAYE